jgi:hypothetical protein
MQMRAAHETKLKDARSPVLNSFAKVRTDHRALLKTKPKDEVVQSYAKQREEHRRKLQEVTKKENERYVRELEHLKREFHDKGDAESALAVAAEIELYSDNPPMDDIPDLQDDVNQTSSSASVDRKASRAGTSSWRMTGEYPLIAGRWAEAEKKGIFVTVQQDDNKFVANCTYKNPEGVEVHWCANGTIAKDGEITARLVHTRPQGLASQTRTGKLDDDGKTLHLHAKLDNGDQQDLTWTLKEPSTNSSAEILEEQDRANLLGTWNVQNIGNNKSHVWTFRGDGKMVNLNTGAVIGTWRIEPAAVRITWPSFIPNKNERYWESFHRPIRPQGVRGDSWTGADRIRAVKKDAATPVEVEPQVAGTKKANNYGVGSDQIEAEKSPAPDAVTQAEAMKLIKEVYGDEYTKAKTSAEKQALAKKLLGKANENKDNPASQFVLLTLARDIAVQAEDRQTAFQSIGAMAEAFQVNGIEMKAASLSKLATAAQMASQHKSIATVALNLVDQAVAKDNFAVADELGKLALDEARKTGDKELIAQAQGRLSDLDRLTKEYADVSAARVTLAKTPDDPEANQVVGKYLCFAKGDWDKGSPMLALGKDETLKLVAKQELEGAASSTEQAKLGDVWWDLAEKQEGTTKKQVQARAGYWYQKALPGLSGLMKDKVEKRLRDIGDRENLNVTVASDWLVIFRSSDPAIWNTGTNLGANHFAIQLTEVPQNIRYLRMRMMDSQKCVIAEISKDRLGIQSAKGQWGWNGTNEFKWGEYHLGIYDVAQNAAKDGQVYLGSGNTCRGWGFGHIHHAKQQGYTWNRMTISKTVFEISVKSGGLLPSEERNLLH